jgi:drug/metabolite transporter (DMT)-like permease
MPALLPPSASGKARQLENFSLNEAGACFMSNTPRIAYVFLLAAAIIYGAIFSVNKMAAVAATPPLAQGFWQSLGGGLLLWIVLTLKAEKLPVSQRHLLSYLIIGALAVGIPMSLLTYAVPHLPAGLQTIVLALSPPLTYLLGMLARIERFRVLGLLGLAFGFAGVLVVIFGLGIEASTPEAWQWFALSLIAPLLFACCNLAAALLRPPLSSSLSMATGMLLGSSAMLIPIMFIAGQASLPTGSGAIAALLAAAINAVFFVLFFEVIRLAGPTFFAQFNYLAVLAGVGWSIAIFGEALSIDFFVAMLLMFAGVFLSARGAPPPAGPALEAKPD